MLKRLKSASAEMGQNFNTVGTEVIRWKSFTLESEVYDLSHLHAHHAEYLDDRNANKPIIYKFIVTYGLHCFTKELDAWRVTAPLSPRHQAIYSIQPFVKIQPMLWSV
jgi:hypothetical protein